MFKKIAVKAALEAGRYIKKNVGKVKSVRYKGEINVVTEIDKRSEDMIVRAIGREFPSHGIMAEERDYAGAKSAGAGSEYSWIIDPLDGTTNFLHGFPFFSVSIGLARKDRVILGAVYDPMREELFTAEKGKGAFLNSKSIHVSRIRNIRKALLVTGFAYNLRLARDNNIKNFVKFLKVSQAVRRAGSAALDLCYVASGRFDGFWELYLSPWDTAAGKIIVEEAGGKVTKFDGTAYSIRDKNILASNKLIHPRMKKILLDC